MGATGGTGRLDKTRGPYEKERLDGDASGEREDQVGTVLESSELRAQSSDLNDGTYDRKREEEAKQRREEVLTIRQP